MIESGGMHCDTTALSTKTACPTSEHNSILMSPVVRGAKRHAQVAVAPEGLLLVEHAPYHYSYTPIPHSLTIFQIAYPKT